MAGGGVNSVEIIAKLINRGETIVDGIVRMQQAVEGSVNLLLMTQEAIYAARDRYGRFPLTVGREIRSDGNPPGLVAATESSSFPNLGYEQVRSLGPGEIVRLAGGEIVPERPASAEKQVCAFMWIYTGYPSSVYEGIGVENARERCGRAMARGDEVEADLVTGVPDSGVGHAIGYAMESGLPFRRPLVKYTPGYGRSYTPPSQDIRDLVATMKLSAVRDVIKGNRMVVCEDSIVRGTQLKNYTIRKLWDNGAKEIHVRPACPPLMFPCRYASSTRTVSELATHRAIRDLEGGKNENPEAYLDHRSQPVRPDDRMDPAGSGCDLTALSAYRRYDRRHRSSGRAAVSPLLARTVGGSGKPFLCGYAASAVLAEGECSGGRRRRDRDCEKGGVLLESVRRRKTTKSLSIGGVRIGGDAPIVVQSMTSTDTRGCAGHGRADPGTGSGRL